MSDNSNDVTTNTTTDNTKQTHSEIMLTTIDNPYNPFTHWDDWLAFDVARGYNTCAYLARVAHTSDELSEEDNDQAIETAIDEIISLNILGKYLKITKDSFIKRT